ncbi:thiolase-like protein, partial [Vararia minispora EC-137]
MDLTADPPCIVGAACRLPGNLAHSSALFARFQSGDWPAASTLPPPSRAFHLHSTPESFGRGGWLAENGVESFDAAFFRIPPTESPTLRPNVRLALELTYDALLHAGIPPSSLRGKNVAVAFGVGTEDGWDIRRAAMDDDHDGGKRSAFDDNWAASSDPSGVSGRVSHFFDFRGPSSVLSNACASGGFALRDGVLSLLHDGAELAVVGALATHFSPASFLWAQASGVASSSGRCASFSPDADGYSPSEGAVVLVLKRQSAAAEAGDAIHARIRSVATAHNGGMRTMFTPNAHAQAQLMLRALAAAKLTPQDIDILEAHGSGTPVGDTLELEGIRRVFHGRTRNPLLLSSAKTVLGHCHGSAFLVG